MVVALVMVTCVMIGSSIINNEAKVLEFPGNDPTASDYYDYVDLHTYDGVGTVTNFANMQDTDTGTYATLTSEGSLGLDQVFQFTGIATGWSYLQLRLGIAAGSQSMYVYADENSYPTTYRGVYGTTSGTFPINYGDANSGSFYVRFFTNATSPRSLLIHSLYVSLTDNTAPAWRDDLMPAGNQWYASNPSLHVRFEEDCLLTNGFYDVNAWPASPEYVLMFGNLYQPTWDRTTWTMSASKWNNCPQGQNTLYFYVEHTGYNPGGTLGGWSWTFNKDTVNPPAASPSSTSHTPSTWSSGNTIDVSWSAPDDGAQGSGIAGYRISWTSSPADPGTSSVNCATTSVTSATLTDGTYYFNIRARDNVGLWSGSTSIGPFWIDTTAPDVPVLASGSHAIDAWSADACVNVSWTPPSDHSGSGIQGYSYVWCSGSPVSPDGTVDTAGTSASQVLAEGTHYFCIRAVDNLNQVSTYGYIGPFKIDLTNPDAPSPASTSHITGTWIADPVVNVSWVVPSDAGGSGIGGYALCWTQDTGSDPGPVISQNTTSMSSPVLSDGTWYFNIRAVDGAGRGSGHVSIGPFLIDTTPPVINAPSDVKMAVGSMGRSITWSFSDSHPCNVSIHVDGVLKQSLPWTNDTFGLSLDGLAPGTHYYTITIIDEAGNAATDTVVVIVETGVTGLDDMTIIIIVVSIAGIGAIVLGMIINKKRSNKPRGSINKARTGGSAPLERDEKSGDA